MSTYIFPRKRIKRNRIINAWFYIYIFLFVIIVATYYMFVFQVYFFFIVIITSWKSQFSRYKYFTTFYLNEIWCPLIFKNEYYHSIHVFKEKKVHYLSEKTYLSFQVHFLLTEIFDDLNVIAGSFIKEINKIKSKMSISLI